MPTVLEQIRDLDPVRDHQRIVFLSTRIDFPFDTTRALEFALFRTFAVPAISGLLDRTGEFLRASQKRYDDTDIIVSEMMEWGYDSERGKRALRRMNQQHGRFDIANDDFLYVLSTFIYEPIRWNSKYGWRPMVEAEKLAMFHFWREVGRRMNIRDIPEDFETFERFNIDYEEKNYRFSEANRRIGTETIEMFARWFPRPVRFLVRKSMVALMDPPLIEAFGFAPPSRLMRWLVREALGLRAVVLLKFWPRRKKPFLRTEGKHRSYPQGYVIENLGPAAEPEKETAPR
jgi:hypothetical protein